MGARALQKGMRPALKQDQSPYCTDRRALPAQASLPTPAARCHPARLTQTRCMQALRSAAQGALRGACRALATLSEAAPGGAARWGSPLLPPGLALDACSKQAASGERGAAWRHRQRCRRLLPLLPPLPPLACPAAWLAHVQPADAAQPGVPPIAGCRLPALGVSGSGSSSTAAASQPEPGPRSGEPGAAAGPSHASTAAARHAAAARAPVGG